MPDNCLVCDRIKKTKDNINAYFVAELKTGYVVIGDFQFFKGYTLFLCKEHKIELHNLKDDFKINFLKEMSEVAEAVYNTFKPKKLNYELLGNSESHLHWHIFPRYKNDPLPNNPIWCIDKSIRCAKSAKPTKNETKYLKEKLLKELNKTASNIIMKYI